MGRDATAQKREKRQFEVQSMMLGWCEKRGHKIRVVKNENGYDEYCETCNAHAGIIKPKKVSP